MGIKHDIIITKKLCDSHLFWNLQMAGAALKSKGYFEMPFQPEFREIASGQKINR